MRPPKRVLACMPLAHYPGDVSVFCQFERSLGETVRGSRLSFVCSLLCAFSFSFFFLFFFLFLSFMLLFQAVSPQLPHAGSSDIHFSLYTSTPSPLSSSSSFPHLPAERSQVSIWFGTLTSLSCFSSFFPFKAQNLSPSLSL